MAVSALVASKGMAKQADKRRRSEPLKWRMAGRRITRKATNKSKSFSPKAAAVAPKRRYVQSVSFLEDGPLPSKIPRIAPTQNRIKIKGISFRAAAAIEVSISALTATHDIEIESKN